MQHKFKRRLLVAGLLLIGLVQGAYAKNSSAALAGSINNSSSSSSKGSKKPHHRKRVKHRHKAHSKNYMNGMASYYANKFSGRRMANGYPLDSAEYTGAHPALRLGSKVKVTNLRNHKSIYVEITDRMPKSSGHVIDLTTAGAEALGFTRRGLAPVKLKLLSEREFKVAEIAPSKQAASAQAAN